MSYSNTESNTLPSSLTRALLEWYDQNARVLPWRTDKEPYHVWLSEIMLQQTGVEVVKEYYLRFLDAFPTIQALAEAEEQKVLKLWEGLGYYSRARNLMRTARIVVEKQSGRFPDTYEEILKLPGVGPYTAGAIASICYEHPIPAVDGNVVRVVTRLADIRAEVTEAVKKHIMTLLEDIYPVGRCGDFTQSLMELGAVVCIPNGMPKCSICPVSDLCIAFKSNDTMSLPVKKQKPAKKTQELTVFHLSFGDETALRRREDSGLLSGLWELPNVSGILNEHEAVKAAAEWGVKPLALIRSSRRSHVFTHVRWDMLCYYIQCGARPSCLSWASRPQLADTYVLPTAFKKLLE